MTHTPGPWTYDDTYGLILAKDHTEIAACHSGIKANNKLIAASPEMFETLQECLRLLTDPNAEIQDADAVEIKIREILKKVNGN